MPEAPRDLLESDPDLLWNDPINEPMLNRAVARSILKHPRWLRLESRLQTYTRRYKRKLVYYEDRFQF